MPGTSLRKELYSIIFKHDTRAGTLFDVVVLWLVLISVAFVIIESVQSIADRYATLLHYVHWTFTALFTIEYLLRLYSAEHRLKYATSFYGIVDLLSILPSYIGIFVPGTHHLLILRVLRLFRIFRVFQMGNFVTEGTVVAHALKASQRKITVFLGFVLIAAILLGALMYMVEARHNPNINDMPDGIYWAIVTLTTVGYGDVIPITYAGRFLASIVMILGYAVIAVPIGIVTSEISSRVLTPQEKKDLFCRNCHKMGHHEDASFCRHCGSPLDQV